jgi:hypothetical protein
MRLLALALVTGCTFRTNAAGPTDGPLADTHRIDAPRNDGPIDARLTSDAPPGCDGASPLILCVNGTPSGTLSLFNLLIDTDDCIGGQKLGQANGPIVCTLAAATITVDGLVRAEGSLPLALVATQSLSVDANALLDVSSSRANGPGAGADPSDCATTAGTSNMQGGGGGAGGSFGTAGGNGGTGAASGGVAAAATGAPDELRGGCPGGNGGDGQDSGGTGGPGGGAIYLLSRGSLSIEGAVDASGAAGSSPSPSKSGGGAGGSGGMIALWSAGSLTISGQLYANGGGGAGGSGTGTGSPGNESAGPTFAGTGGAGGSMAGAGGDGAIASSGGNPGASGSKGGGGGGGGVGVIRDVSGQTLGGSLSPPPI